MTGRKLKRAQDAARKQLKKMVEAFSGLRVVYLHLKLERKPPSQP